MFDDWPLAVWSAAFGAVMGWGMGRFTSERSPILLSLAAAIAIGSAMRMVGGPDLAAAGTSLILGGATAVLGVLSTIRPARV